MTELVWNGQTITEPGVYAHVSMERYHGDLCDGPSISSSGLRTIENRSPLHYWATSYLNPDRPEEEAKDYLDLGKAVHTLLLSEEGFRDQFVTRPAEWTDWRTAASREWRDKQREAGRSILTTNQLQDIEGIADRVASDSDAVELLRGRIERSIVWRDRTGVWVKSRPDSIPRDSILCDLKTTMDASEVSISRSILNYGYLQQMALAIEGMHAVGASKIDEAVLLFVETRYPYAYNIKPLDNGDVYFAMRQNRRALDTFADCLARQHWPTYATSTQTYSAPDWWTKRLEKDPTLPENKEAA